MFLNYANSPEDKPEGNANKDKLLFINSCGTYRLYTKPRLQTFRPNGRVDYQLIYIASGKGYFYFHNDSPTVVDAGNIVLYRPGDTHQYVYYGKDCPDIYWIHFTGSDIAGLLRKHGIEPEQRVIAAGTSSGYAHIFERIIAELQLQKDFYEEASAVLFMQLLLLIGRSARESAPDRENLLSEEIHLAAIYLHEHYREAINIESYIEGKSISTSSFFRKFKQYTGMTPLQYLLEIRLSNAKKLLETTDYSINEISFLIGYENALYFSRIFHKHVGLSPKEYRKSVRKNTTPI